MASRPEMNDLVKTSPTTTKDKDGGTGVPSGFILKLYQMVNGASDDIISWVPNGDAFKIGADLNRLESETLPQDRPHDLHLLRRRTCPGVDGRKNRFSAASDNLKPSSATSIGMGYDRDDVSRVKTTSSEDDSCSADDSASESEETNSCDSDRNGKRRLSFLSKRSQSPVVSLDKMRVAKRKKRSAEARIDPDKGKFNYDHVTGGVTVDLSLVSPEISRNGIENLTRIDCNPKEDDDEESRSHCRTKEDRQERLEQSLVVSQVAMKLEEYAKKAKKAKSKGLKSSGRGRASREPTQGVVTPPVHNPTLKSESSSGVSVKYPYMNEQVPCDDSWHDSSDPVVSEIKVKIGSCDKDLAAQSDVIGVGVVTDGDESPNEEDQEEKSAEQAKMCLSYNQGRLSGGSQERIVAVTLAESQQGRNNLFSSPPVGDGFTISTISQKILTRMGDVGIAAVASFCMATPPAEHPDLCRKILNLLASCDMLAVEFQKYRSALCPVDFGPKRSTLPAFSSNFHPNHAVSLLQIWGRCGSRKEAVRFFKVFAVNRIETLARGGRASPDNPIFSQAESSTLQHVADVWFKSVRPCN
eukprot:scaffold2747_cov51-Attheya_sp.AAC.3